MPVVDLSSSLKTIAQIPLNAKLYFKTLLSMIDLGENDFKAFYYYDSMIATCVENNKQYIWKERGLEDTGGLLNDDFVYPQNTISNEINYSGKSYNFFLFNEISIVVPKPNEILSGSITPLGGLNFISTQIYYRFNNNILIAPITNFTLSDSDPLLPRTDTVVVNSSGLLEVLEGVPSANPQEPTIDFQTQLRVTKIEIAAGATEPTNYSEEIIYDENLGTPSEWEGSSGLSTNIDFNIQDEPYSGLIHIDGNNILANDEITFFKGANVDLLNLSLLAFALKSKTEKTFNIYIKLTLNGIGVTSYTLTPNNYGFNPTLIADYQIVSIPFNQINPSNLDFDGIVFAFGNGSTNSHVNGLFLDKIRLVYGSENIEPIQDFLSLTDTPNTYTGHSKKKVVVKENEQGLEFQDDIQPFSTKVLNGEKMLWYKKSTNNTNDVQANEVLSGVHLNYFYPALIYVSGPTGDFSSYRYNQREKLFNI